MHLERTAILAGLGLVFSVAVGCGRAVAVGAADRAATGGPFGSLREAGLAAPDDPTVRGARLVPATLDEAHTWGADPGGGVRAIVAGVRVVSSPIGDVLAATSRLPASPSSVVELPERLGGGFLMALGPHLWRADTWFGPAVPVFTLPSPIVEILVGLDRVYLRSAQAALFAIDPRTGQGLDIGPLPASPRIASIVALDAWRAVVIADLRGTLLTVDAGSSWRGVALPIEPARASTLEEAFAVGGVDRARGVEEWWEILPDGQTVRLGASPLSDSDRASAPVGATAPRPLGFRPLVAAIEDGWPLTDGTALVARDGFLVRVRLADGAVVETVADAFPMKSARCHPLSLSQPGDRGAFGFVCGEPRGTTTVFRWDERDSRLVELRRFESPREVLASGNGNLAVRGPCAPQVADESSWVRDQPWCIMTASHGWNEMHFVGSGVDRARLVVLSNGRTALIRPPEGGDLSTARLTVTDGLRATHLPLRAQPLSAEVVRALRFGVWMDGFEERDPGVLSGWVDAAGSILGVQISLDGEVRVGEYIRDAGAPIASGRWAFGWTASGGGFESTDGGMSWTKEIALPDPIVEPKSGRDRGCGPVGCIIAGWLRLGWGAQGAQEASPSPEPPPARSRAMRRAPSLTLECEPLGAVRPPNEVARPQPSPPPLAARPLLRAPPASRGSRTASGATATPFRPFAGRAPPAVPEGDRGLSIEASNALDRGFRSAPLARVYAWGPSSGDWDPLGRWQVRWQWPWGGWQDVRSSAASASPWPTLEVATRALSGGIGVPPESTLVAGDDADHALLVMRRTGAVANAGGVALEVLDADRAPVEVRRASGEPLPEIQGAMRSGGHWYFATAQSLGEAAATVLWFVDGSVAHELGRVPRVGQDPLPTARLARRSAGASIVPVTVGLVVAGPDFEYGARLWVAGFDSEAHVFRQPEPIAPFDLSDRPVAACTGDDAGWEVEMSYPASVEVRAGRGFSSRLQGAVARLRLWHGGACVDRVFGSAAADSPHALDDIWATPVRPLSAPGPDDAEAQAARTIGVSALVEGTRVALRCRRLSL